MIHVGAKEMRERQAEMLDTVQREPVTIERNGRPIAVLYSYEEAKAIEQTKLELLKAKLARADKAISQGRYEPFNQGVIEQIKSEERKKL
ncbi:MAG: type II toxin-antitoxin system Phd/YefM family antitoxin [Pseudomonadota bacterium]|nr:type II toxin-antitoxin system Phd/YefM family antitoxin [Pseudomonadota bacterium]